jgi:Sec7-like guanine-nucleotide exchange factor
VCNLTQHLSDQCCWCWHADSQCCVQNERLLPTQVLALELLKVLLENSGRVFASSEKFADGIKHYLCLSLLKNCASANPHALRLSCSIFLTLISKFRHSLKAEVSTTAGSPDAAMGDQRI